MEFMLKLLQINTSVNTGSTGRIAEEIGSTAMKAGFGSYIAYGRMARESKSQLIHIGNVASVRRHALTSRLWDNHGFASTKATKLFVKGLERINPDIIHLHNLHGYYLNVEVLFDYLKKVQKPIVWTLHDCWPMTGHCSHFDFVRCDRWKTGCYACPNLKGYPVSLFLDRSKQNFEKKKKIFTEVSNITFVTPSHWLKSVVQESFFENYPVKVIHNGVDLDVFKPIRSEEVRSKYDIQYDTKIVLGVASIWGRRKGLNDFVQLKERMGEDVQIILVGLNEKQLSNLPKGILGIRRTENVEELAALYAMADVFVNPTWVDNFPTTNIEALACGTPVVTYQTGGSPEAITDVTGKVVERGDVEALREAILEILVRERDVYRIECRERAEKFFNKEDRYRDYVELYKSLI